MNEEQTNSASDVYAVDVEPQPPKKPSLWIWLLVIVFGFVLPGISALMMPRMMRQMVTRVENEWAHPLATEFVELGESGHTDGAYELCSEGFREATSEQELADVFEELKEAGDFDSLEAVGFVWFTEVPGETETHMSYSAKFESRDVLLNFVFLDDGSGQFIEGFDFDLDGNGDVSFWRDKRWVPWGK